MIAKLKSVLRCAALLFLVPAIAHAASPWTAVNRTLVDEHIVPRYQQLASTTVQLDERSHAFCAKPDQAGLDDVRAAFHQTMDAWMGIQHMRFGPVENDLRYSRFQTWPDKHNTSERQLRQALAEQDVARLSEEKFPHASVALQGLSAFERLLYDDSDEFTRFGEAERSTYPCLLLAAIAHNLERMSADVLREWTAAKPSYREIVLEAGQGNRHFESSEEFSARMLNNLYTALQFIVDQKLMLPVGASPAGVNPRGAESWRSRRSLRNIVLNLEAAEALYMSGYSPILTADPKSVSLDQEIRRSFAQTLRAARDIEQPLFQALQSPEQRPALDRLVAAASELKRLLGGPLPAALGLKLGFNSLDGD